MYAIEAQNISKKFGSIVANKNINFSVEKGEVRAILGENGAGKTTLMNILYGLYKPDAGKIYIDGRKVHISSPKDAISKGLGMVHQHFMLVPTFTVAENMVLGMQEQTGIKLSYRDMNQEICEFFEQYNFNVDVKQKVENLPVGLQQRVEIMKALYRGADVLILDEPTAVLTPQETKELFKIIRVLQKEGKSVIFISHKLNEVMEISDKVSVLRAGEIVSTFETANSTKEMLCESMIGRKLKCITNTGANYSTTPKIEIKNLNVLDKKRLACKDINLQVNAGEILGIAGVDGNGQSELCEALTGLRKIESGEIIIEGTNTTNMSVSEIIGSGVAHVPEDRQARGLILDFTVKENFILEEHGDAKYSKYGFLDDDSITKNADALIKEFNIVTDGRNALTSSLSGGNQQKIILAREISRDPEVLVIMKPTRGLDVGAIEYVHGALLKEKEKGKAIILISSELEEIMALSDRIAVMYEGQINGLVWPTIKAEEIGLIMAGSEKKFDAAKKGEINEQN